MGWPIGLAVGRQTDQNSLDVANSMFYFVHTLHKYYIILYIVSDWKIECRFKNLQGKGLTLGTPKNDPPF